MNDTFTTNFSNSDHFRRKNYSYIHDGEKSGYLDNLPILIPMAVSLYFLSFVTFFGNALVLHAIRTERRLQTVSNMFIMSLAVSDLVVGLCVMPISSAYAIIGEWKFGIFVCQFWLSVDYTASTASILNLLILSFDRYWSIRSPLKYLRTRTKRRASIMLTIVWISSALWIVPIQFWHYWYNGGIRKNPENVCETEFVDNLVIKIFTSVLNFYLPMVLLVIVYIRIFIEIKKRSSVELGVCCSSDYPTNLDQSESTSEDTTRVKYVSGNVRPRTECYNNLTILCLDSKHNEAMNKNEVINEINVKVEVDEKYDSETESLSNIRNGINSSGTKYINHIQRVLRRICNKNFYRHRRRDNIELNDYPALRRNVLKENTPKYMESGAKGRKDVLKQNKKKNKVNLNKRHAGQSLRSEKKAARQLGVILSAFILCWLPYSILFLVMAFNSDFIDVRIHTASIWLGYMNSTMNPIIYPLCNTKFKRAFKRILHLNISSTNNVTTNVQNFRRKNLD